MTDKGLLWHSNTWLFSPQDCQNLLKTNEELQQEVEELRRKNRRYKAKLRDMAADYKDKLERSEMMNQELKLRRDEVTKVMSVTTL